MNSVQVGLASFEGSMPQPSKMGMKRQFQAKTPKFNCSSSTHRRSQDFVCGGELYSSPKIWWPFFVFSRHPPLHGHVRHIVPATTFLSLCGGCTHQIQPHFCLIPTKMPRIFFIALGVHLHPMHTPLGYAYGLTSSTCIMTKITDTAVEKYHKYGIYSDTANRWFVCIR